MNRRQVIAAAAAAAMFTGVSAAAVTAAEVRSSGEPVTVHLTLGQDVGTMLPMDSNVDDNIAVLDVVYDGLVRYDPETTEPHNYVAESVETTDNQTWTITIKPDLTFHNGEPVDANAFARAWNYAAYGPNAMANNYFFERFEGYDAMQGETDDDGNVTVEPEADALSGITVVDDLTLEVTLNAPFAGFATMLGYTGFFPIAQECLDDIDACAVQPIGNGPFQVESWEQGIGLTATRWADYTLDEAPTTFDRIEWTEYAGASDWPDFLAGNLDASAPPPSELAAAEADPDLQSRYVERPGAALTYLGFPLYLDGPWTDIEFRKAISMAIDREGILTALTPGQFMPADSWVVPGAVPGGEAGTCEWCVFDPEAAVAALEAAGGWPEGEVLSISLGQNDTQEQIFKAIGDSIQATLGIPYELNPTPDFFANRRERAFTGPFRNNWFPDYPLNENYLAPVYASGDPEGNTNFGYYSEAFEAAIAAGDQAATLEEAVTHYQEAEAILAADFPTVPLYTSVSSAYYSERLANVVLDPFSGRVKLRVLEVSDAA